MKKTLASMLSALCLTVFVSACATTTPTMTVTSDGERWRHAQPACGKPVADTRRVEGDRRTRRALPVRWFAADCPKATAGTTNAQR